MVPAKEAGPGPKQPAGPKLRQLRISFPVGIAAGAIEIRASRLALF